MSSYPSDWDSRRRRVYRRDGYSCQNCGAYGGPHGGAELHAHHIVPKSKGGTDNLGNLRTLCKHCHNAIHHKNKMAPTNNGNAQASVKYGSSGRLTTHRESGKKSHPEDEPGPWEYLMSGVLIFGFLFVAYTGEWLFNGYALPLILWIVFVGIPTSYLTWKYYIAPQRRAEADRVARRRRQLRELSRDKETRRGARQEDRADRHADLRDRV